MSAVITTDMLKAAKACVDQLALFNATFGDSVIVTRKTVDAALAAGVDVLWAGKTLLGGKFKRAYNATTDEARKAFNAATDDAFTDAYTAQCQTAKVPA